MLGRKQPFAATTIALLRAVLLTIGAAAVLASAIKWGVVDRRTSAPAAPVHTAAEGLHACAGTSNGSGRHEAAAEFLRHCTSLECLRTVHGLSSPQQTRFNFPHFFVIGWTNYLVRQPQVAEPLNKEPRYFIGACRRGRCPAEWNDESYYVQHVLHAANATAASAFSRAAFEASAGYAQAGPNLASRLRQELPWLKLVVSMREPISRAISVQNMARDMQANNCLVEDSDLFPCLKEHFQVLNNYSSPLASWIAEFPREQLFIIQYESLTGSLQSEVLRALNAFLGLDPAPPGAETLGHLNNKKGTRAKGWALLQRQYEYLVELVRPDAKRVAELLGEHGLGDSRSWLTAWEEVWRDNLENNCDANGDCEIYVT